MGDTSWSTSHSIKEIWAEGRGFLFPLKKKKSTEIHPFSFIMAGFATEIGK